MKVTNKVSKKTLSELELIRSEMKKIDPNGTKIFILLCGAKYNKDI